MLGVESIYYPQILHLEYEINYTIISLKVGKQLITATILKKLETRLLSYKNFIRVNKNLDYIKPIDDTFTLSNFRKVVFSRRRGKVWKEPQVA